MSEMKHEQVLADSDLPAFFRKLADILEGKEAESELDALNICTFAKAKISLKRRHGQTTAKLKVCGDGCGGSSGDGAPEFLVGRSDGESVIPAGGRLPSYSGLKKRMKSDFKHIYQAIHSNVMPAAPIVEAFLNDSDLMCRYSGKGDEFYPAYLAACDEFRKAYASEDMAALHTAVEELNHQKSECHSRYK